MPRLSLGWQSDQDSGCRGYHQPGKYWFCRERENITSGLHGNYSLQINIISGDYIYSMDLFISSGMSLCYFILQQEHSHMNKHDEAFEGCYLTLIPVYVFYFQLGHTVLPHNCSGVGVIEVAMTGDWTLDRRSQAHIRIRKYWKVKVRRLLRLTERLADYDYCGNGKCKGWKHYCKSKSCHPI